MYAGAQFFTKQKKISTLKIIFHMAHFVGYTSPVCKNKKITKRIICEIIKLQKTPCLNYIQKIIPYISDKITWTVQILQI